MRYHRWRTTTPIIDLRMDRELYRNRINLTKKQAFGVVVYGLVGIAGGLILIVGSLIAVWVDLPRDGLKILFPICLPFGGGILTLLVAVRITVNAAHRLLSKQPRDID